jgi:hypothetical protein
MTTRHPAPSMSAASTESASECRRRPGSAVYTRAHPRRVYAESLVRPLCLFPQSVYMLAIRLVVANAIVFVLTVAAVLSIVKVLGPS